MKKINLFLLFLLLINNLYSERIYKEKTYQYVFNNYINGIMEYRLADKTRIDVITTKYAIEIDFANKFYEAIGQALYYSCLTGLQPGIVLIMEKENDKKYLVRLLKLNKLYEIDVWIINKKFEIKKIGE